MSINKVAIFSLGEKGLKVVENLIKLGLSQHIEAVIIGTDKNVIKDFSEELGKLCKDHKISILQRKTDLNLTSNYWFAIGWRWIISNPKNIELIVFHESILPKYRGFSPLVNQLINGEKSIGVTALKASKEFDKGPILFQETVAIFYPIKIQEAIQIVIPLYCNLTEKILKQIIEGGKIQYTNQNDKNATYSLWRDSEDYKIDWNLSSKRIKRSVDALGFPFQGATSSLNGKEIIIHEVEIATNRKIENRDGGKVLFFEGDFPIVVCRKGLLKITKANFKEENQSIFPLKKYRSRFN